MKAAIYHRFGEKIEIQQVPTPQCPPQGVLIQVAATGICRSDWHGWQGHDPDIQLPHVPGHEFAGTILEVGPEVRHWQKGAAVTAPFIQFCGHCHDCSHGHGEVCINQRQAGFTDWGSFAEIVAVDLADQNLVPLPEGMSFDTAASLGCRFATAYRAVTQLSGLRPGQWLAVHGCGGVGLAAIMTARAMGALPIAIDIDEETLNQAQGLGAVATLNSGDTPDIATAIHDVTHGGAHASLDALGHSQTAYNSVACLRRRGTHVQIGLMAEQHALAPLPWADIIAKELRIQGSHGMCAPHYPELFAQIANGCLSPDQLISQRVNLDEGVDILQNMGQTPPQGVAVITKF